MENLINIDDKIYGYKHISDTINRTELKKK